MGRLHGEYISSGKCRMMFRARDACFRPKGRWTAHTVSRKGCRRDAQHNLVVSNF
jgi:hypothetical protein